MNQQKSIVTYLLQVLMSLSSVLQDRLTNGWGDPVRITLSADTLGHGARTHDNSASE